MFLRDHGKNVTEYRRLNGQLQASRSKIWPVYAHYEYEEEQKLVCCIKEWQQGALDYIEQKKNYLKEDEDYVKFAQPLIAIGKNPTLKMVKLFSFFYIQMGKKNIM